MLIGLYYIILFIRDLTGVYKQTELYRLRLDGLLCYKSYSWFIAGTFFWLYRSQYCSNVCIYRPLHILVFFSRLVYTNENQYAGDFKDYYQCIGNGCVSLFVPFEYQSFGNTRSCKCMHRSCALRGDIFCMELL